MHKMKIYDEEKQFYPWKLNFCNILVKKIQNFSFEITIKKEFKSETRANKIAFHFCKIQNGRQRREMRENCTHICNIFSQVCATYNVF